MEEFATLFYGLFLGIIAFVIARFIAGKDDFYRDNYFKQKWGGWFEALVKGGLNKEEAYEKIIAQQDAKIQEQFTFTLFFAILMIFTGAGLFVLV